MEGQEVVAPKVNCGIVFMAPLPFTFQVLYSFGHECGVKQRVRRQGSNKWNNWNAFNGVRRQQRAIGGRVV